MGKKKAEETVAAEPAEPMVTDAAAAGAEEDDYERKVRYVSVIAKPLASRKLTKRVLKTVRKGTLFPPPNAERRGARR